MAKCASLKRTSSKKHVKSSWLYLSIQHLWILSSFVLSDVAVVCGSEWIDVKIMLYHINEFHHSNEVKLVATFVCNWFGFCSNWMNSNTSWFMYTGNVCYMYYSRRYEAPVSLWKHSVRCAVQGWDMVGVHMAKMRKHSLDGFQFPDELKSSKWSNA